MTEQIETGPILELNMTPLIDVLLVLIIMLIITIPKQNHTSTLTLQGAPATQTEKPRIVALDVDFDGSLSWDGKAVGNRAALETRLAALAAEPKPTEVHLRANKLAPYKVVAGVLATAQRQGVRNIGMVGNEQFI